jgi:2-polyprenyl-6-methoxyphenol hydroxylase-like FAD-dependent oxidoreductase
MTEQYDVVVVGARCAGATLAFHLARAGLSVALVDRARFPSDTLSTHFIETPGVTALERMGVLEEVLTAGAPPITAVDYRIGDAAGVTAYGEEGTAQRPGLCVRRTVLDAALVAAAEAAGARVRTGSRVTGVNSTDQRVTGVVVIDESGRECQLDAAIVVGADGAGSTVARMVGARRYHVHANERFAYWGYFEGATEPGPPALFFHRFDNELYVGSPCERGLYMAAVVPTLDELPAFGENLDGAFADVLARSEPFAAILAGARRVGPLRGMANFPGFFRESAGPGWALVGDAGHFADPASGQGMSDAFRQAERLAEDVVRGLDGAASPDDALVDWWRWRDAEDFEMHWLSADIGAAGPVPVVMSEFVRQLDSSPGGMWDFWGMFHRRVAPSDVFTPERFGAVAAELAATPLAQQAMAELAFMGQVAEERAALAASPRLVDDASRLAAARPVTLSA